MLLRISLVATLLTAVSGCMWSPGPSASEAGATAVPVETPHRAVDGERPLDQGEAGVSVETSQSTGVAWSTRWILTDTLINARDLGGVPIASGAMPYGVLFRGPPLAGLSPGDCEELARLGIRTVIDLRVQTEREAKPEAPCVGERAQVISAPLPVPYNVSREDYIADLYALDAMTTAFAALGRADAYPVYIHCTWGRDRTGLVAALILRALGAIPEDILREYSLSELSVGAYPGSLQAALQEVEEGGGISGYLATLGFDDTHLDQLRAAVQ